MDWKTFLFFCFMVLNAIVLSELYLELNEVKSFMNDKTLILNKELSSSIHINTVVDYCKRL